MALLVAFTVGGGYIAFQRGAVKEEAAQESTNPLTESAGGGPAGAPATGSAQDTSKQGEVGAAPSGQDAGGSGQSTAPGNMTGTGGTGDSASGGSAVSPNTGPEAGVAGSSSVGKGQAGTAAARGTGPAGAGATSGSGSAGAGEAGKGTAAPGLQAGSENRNGAGASGGGNTDQGADSGVTAGDAMAPGAAKGGVAQGAGASNTAGENAAGVGAGGTAQQVSEGDPKAGETVYQANCSGCHGTKANNGAVGPNLRTADGPNTWTLDQFKVLLRQGKTPTGEMVKSPMQQYSPEQLSDTDVANIKAYLKSLQ